MATIDEKKKAEPAAANAQPVVAAKGTPPDFGTLKDEWKALIDRKRPDAESSLLKVTARTTKLDPIVEQALQTMVEKRYAKVQDKKERLENLRLLITEKGWASELDRVIKRINGIRISENKRVILAAVYPYLLSELLVGEKMDKTVEDEIGFTEKVMFELEKAGGPLDQFAREAVNLVGAKHRINFTQDNVLRDLIAHQVRAGL